MSIKKYINNHNWLHTIIQIHIWTFANKHTEKRTEAEAEKDLHMQRNKKKIKYII